MTVAQCVFCQDGFIAEGLVRMLSAKVGEALQREQNDSDNRPPAKVTGRTIATLPKG